MLSDALRVKPSYDEELRRIGAAVNGRLPGSVEVLCAPLKSMSRGMVKIHGKYGGSYKKLTDILRGTLVCSNVEAAVLCAEELSRGAVLVPKRAKNRIDPSFDAGSAGGYRCVPFNPPRVSPFWSCLWMRASGSRPSDSLGEIAIDNRP